MANLIISRAIFFGRVRFGEKLGRLGHFSHFFFVSGKAVNFRFQYMRLEIAFFYHHRRSAFGVSVSVFPLVFLGGARQGG